MGFRTAMDLAGEAKNPQRDVPLAMGVGLAISLFVYLVIPNSVKAQHQCTNYVDPETLHL